MLEVVLVVEVGIRNAELVEPDVLVVEVVEVEEVLEAMSAGSIKLNVIPPSPFTETRRPTATEPVLDNSPVFVAYT